MNTQSAGHSSPRSPRKIPNSTWAEIRTAHASGLGLRELARSTGIPAGTVLARAKREGWTRSVRDAKALGARPATPTVSVATAAAVSMAERGQRHVERVAGIVECALPAVEKMTPDALLDRVEDLMHCVKTAVSGSSATVTQRGLHLRATAPTVARACSRIMVCTKIVRGD